MTTKDYEWFAKADKSKYEAGEYVIIIDQKVVAHTKDRLKDVLNNIRKKYSGKIPLVAKISSKDTLILYFGIVFLRNSFGVPYERTELLHNSVVGNSSYTHSLRS